MGKRLSRDPQKVTAILNAAVKIFGTAGYSASTDQIALAAHVAKGSVFRYFDNKPKLYRSAVRQAMTTLTNVVDLTIWLASDDLVSMIIRATRYKTELSHRYPNEFALLTRVYTHDGDLPQSLDDDTFAIIDKWARRVQHQVVDAMADKLTLRPELEETTVKAFLSMVLQGMTRQIQTYFDQHPGIRRMEDMTEIVDQVTRYMEMLEYGIVRQ